jgi:hypothetical protein
MTPTRVLGCVIVVVGIGAGAASLRPAATQEVPQKVLPCTGGSSDQRIECLSQQIIRLEEQINLLRNDFETITTPQVRPLTAGR